MKTLACAHTHHWGRKNGFLWGGNILIRNYGVIAVYVEGRGGPCMCRVATALLAGLSQLIRLQAAVSMQWLSFPCHKFLFSYLQPSIQNAKCIDKTHDQRMSWWNFGVDTQPRPTGGRTTAGDHESATQNLQQKLSRWALKMLQIPAFMIVCLLTD